MDCPPSEKLSEYLSGTSTEPDAATIDRHLRTCDRCAETLSQLDQATDPWLHQVRAVVRDAEQTDESADDSCAASSVEIIDRLKARSPSAHLDFAQAAEAFAPTAELVLEAGARVANYRVVRMLDQGGMGLVFEAEDEQLARRVAIKFLRPELACQAAFRERFLREARAVAALQDDHIVPIYQVGDHQGLPYLVMPKLSGETLARHVARHGPLSLDETLSIGQQLARGLTAAHAAGLVHRDLKPSNIWLEDLPETHARVVGFRVRILDFGLVFSQPDADVLTDTGVVVGTPGYLAPEQVRSRDEPDPRCDLFALGAVLYECITGKRPYASDNWLVYLESLATTHVAASGLSGPPDFGELVTQLLERDVQRRPESAATVLKRLQDIERLADRGSVAASRKCEASRGESLSLIAASILAMGLLGWWATHLRIGTDGQPLARDRDEPPGTAPLVSNESAMTTTSEQSERTPDSRGSGKQAAELKRALFYEQRFTDEPEVVRQAKSMRSGVENRVFFAECDGAEMRLVWCVYELERLPKDFELEMRMRLRDAEYGMSFRQLEFDAQRRHWEWWENIKGSGRWKIDQTTLQRDASTGRWRPAHQQTLAAGSAEAEPWFPNDQWCTLRVQCVGDHFRLTVDERLVTEFTASPPLLEHAAPTPSGLRLFLQSNAPDRDPRLEIDLIRVRSLDDSTGE